MRALAHMFAAPADDPFAPELIAVHTRGMERWLTQRLSAHLGTTPGRADGVCANVTFSQPHRLVTEAVAAAAGVAPDEDPWPAQRSLWPLLEMIDASLHEPWLSTLRAYLDGGPRRVAAAREIADRFDRYALLRPELLRAWAQGEDGPIAADQAWQPRLWRALRARIGVPSAAERLAGACERLRAQPQLLALPRRVSLFGLTRLPAGHLDVLAAIAAERDVHVFALHPSPALWNAVAQALDGHPPPVRRRDDRSGRLARNRLLASWGADARELQLVLARAGAGVDHRHEHVRGAAPSLLARLQEDVRANRQAPPEPALLAGDDASLRVHACHGRARQVEVLRDAILHLLAADPTLQPRDVVVMCPDIETFAPLIAATFGAGAVTAGDDDDQGAGEGPRMPQLRVRLADRALRQTNPVLGVLAALLELADQRVTASQVLDLAEREPVRRRFAIDDDDLARLREWISRSGIRWGLDAEHRRPYRLAEVPNGTWEAGLARVLLGVAMTEDEQRLFGGVLPLDDVDSGAIDLAGRLAELIARVAEAVDAFAAPMAIDAWAGALATAADALAATAPRDAWQRAQLQRVLDELVGEASVAGTASPSVLSLADVRALLAERLRGRPTRANFRTGQLTVCTLVPMRSVPHRVVCLLGLDDGVFPRGAVHDDDDLTLADPHVGERDGRSEDRQLLLDALLAATDRLIVTYTGNDERTNITRPPAVPVGELLDVVDATARCPDARRPAPASWCDTRSSPSTHAISTAGGLVPGRVWSFDPATLRGAQALSGPRLQARPFLPSPLPAPPPAALALDDLLAFVAHPVRAFLRARLGVSVRDFSDVVEDGLRVELDPLARWEVGDRLLRARLAGVSAREAGLAEIARGMLPPAALGQPVLARVMPAVDRIVTASRASRSPDAATRSPPTCASCSTTGARSAARSPACTATCCSQPPTHASRRGSGSRPGSPCSR